LSITKNFPLTRGTRSLSAFFAFTFAHEFARLADGISDFLVGSEVDYYATLRHPRRRQSYLLGRFAAKLALQQAMSESNPKAFEISSGVFEQPLVLHPSRATPGITISHFEDAAVAVAFPSGHPMGVDFEGIDPARLSAIQSVMSKRERLWADHSLPDQLVLSTLVWTAKEALSKALLCGLMTPMEILSLSEIRRTGSNSWEGLFENFAQYKSVSWASRSSVMSIVFPKNSGYLAEALDFQRIMSQQPASLANPSGFASDAG
jgi:4'-phosphopantetheinyl transferase